MKYLVEIGVKVPDPIVSSVLYPDESNDERSKRFESQRDTYGFDERETWDLGYTSACWLYQHLRMYKDLGSDVIDFSFHKFNIEDSEITQEEAIDKILSLLEEYLKYQNKLNISESFTDEDEVESFNNLKKAFKIYSEIIPAMWW